MPEENYDEEYVINILAEQAELNLKYGQLSGDQSKRNKCIPEKIKKDSEHKIEHKTDKPQLNGMFENKNHVNESERNKRTLSGKSDISTLKDSQTSKVENFDKRDRGNFYHWGATRELMEIFRRRNNSPETRRMVEQRNALTQPSTFRRRFDHQTQLTVYASSRPNKRSIEEIAEIDAELSRTANRLGGGYQPIIEEQEEQPEEEGELDQENNETEEDSILMRGDNSPIVDLTKYNTDGKEAK